MPKGNMPGIKAGFTEIEYFKWMMEWEQITEKLRKFNHLDRIKIVPFIPDEEEHNE